MLYSVLRLGWSRTLRCPTSLPLLPLISAIFACTSPLSSRDCTKPAMASQHKLLTANRGEIAMRILRSARDLALPTVAVYMEADASAPHALQADEAYIVPTYIDQCVRLLPGAASPRRLTCLEPSQRCPARGVSDAQGHDGTPRLRLSE